jgi:hypothetical protein
MWLLQQNPVILNYLQDTDKKIQKATGLQIFL